MDTLSISRALIELKTLEKRIDKGLYALQPVTVIKGGKLETGIKDRETFEKNVSASYQSITALVKRKRLIKSSVVQSNALTKVTIGDETMTVAEAIERKSSISIDKQIVKTLSAKYAESVSEINSHNVQMERQLLQLLQATYSKAETEISPEDYDKIAKPFKENNEAELLDPLDLKSVVKVLEEKIVIFESEVDIALTESNARTEITV